MPNFKKQNKGGRGYGELSDSDLEFLGDAASPWKSDYSGASGQGYNARFDDNEGFRRGEGEYSDSDAHGLRNALPHEATAEIHQDLSRLIDGELDHGSGNKMTGGGGPVSENPQPNHDDGIWQGSGRKGSRFPVKTGPQGNMRRK